MVFGIMNKSIEKILKTFDKLPVNPDDLAHWTSAIETTAKHMCNDKNGKITFKYKVDEKSMKFFVKDPRARDCLVKSIEIHLPSISESLQGFLSVFKYNLKNVKFDK
jgi:predicted Holliday junction resolvase-like endonuclease